MCPNLPYPGIFSEQFYEMHKIGVNVNQLARLANSTSAVTVEEMKELKGMIKEIWHMIISFKPGEISDPNVAHEIATKIADATLKGKHEYVLSTHLDKDHVHCHLIFNATNFVDYHKYVSNKRNYHKICKLSNRICREYGLEESMPPDRKQNHTKKIWSTSGETVGKQNSNTT